MEFATRGQSTAAADGVDDRRRLPDPPPPHAYHRQWQGGNAGLASVDVAALSFRRDTLLRELHKQHILQEMILRELAETERAITVCLATGNQSTSMPIMPPWPPAGNLLSTLPAGQDSWRGRLSILSCEEQLFHAPRLSENTAWWSRSSSEPVIPPVYPHVERSPSPMPQHWLVDNGEKKEHGSSSGPLTIAPSVCPDVEPSHPLAMAPSVCPDVELCQSLIKEPAVKEALIPALTNAVAKPTERDCNEVKQKHQAALGQEHEAERKDSHFVQLTESRIKRNEQPKHAAVGQECKSEAKDSNAVQLMEKSGFQSSEQPKPSELTTEHHINERRQSHPQYALIGKENEKSPSDELKRPDFNKAKPKITPCGLKRRPIGRPVLPSAEKKHKPEEKWSGTLSQLNLVCKPDLALRRANLTAPQARQEPTEPNTKPPTVKEALIPALTNAFAKPTEMDCKEVKQEHQTGRKDSHCMQLAGSGIQRSEQAKHAAVGQDCKAEAKDSNAVQLTEESGIQSSGQPKPAEPTTEHHINEQTQSPPQYSLAGKENKKSLSDEQKRQEFNETKPEITPWGLKRRLARSMLPSPEKKHKPEEKWSGTFSQMEPAREHNSALRRVVKIHWPNLTAPQSKQEPTDPNTKPAAESSQGAHQNIVGKQSQIKLEPRWSGDISQARTASGFDLRSHLSDRRHQEKTVALPVEGGGGEEAKRVYDPKDEDLRKNVAINRMRYSCYICNVQCTSEQNLVSHLEGRRHRETLQGRH